MSDDDVVVVVGVVVVDDDVPIVMCMQQGLCKWLMKCCTGKWSEGVAREVKWAFCLEMTQCSRRDPTSTAGAGPDGPPVGGLAGMTPES